MKGGGKLKNKVLHAKAKPSSRAPRKLSRSFKKLGSVFERRSRRRPGWAFTAAAFGGALLLLTAPGLSPSGCRVKSALADPPSKPKTTIVAQPTDSDRATIGRRLNHAVCSKGNPSFDPPTPRTHGVKVDGTGSYSEGVEPYLPEAEKHRVNIGVDDFNGRTADPKTKNWDLGVDIQGRAVVGRKIEGGTYVYQVSGTLGHIDDAVIPGFSPDGKPVQGWEMLRVYEIPRPGFQGSSDHPDTILVVAGPRYVTFTYYDLVRKMVATATLDIEASTGCTPPKMSLYHDVKGDVYYFNFMHQNAGPGSLVAEVVFGGVSNDGGIGTYADGSGAVSYFEFTK